MNILENAKKIAKEKEELNIKKQNEEDVLNKQLNTKLDGMKSVLLEELSKINGQDSKYGKFKLNLKTDLIHNIIATLEVENKKVAWFKAKICKNTFGYLNDWSNSYTDPTIWARFYPPIFKYGDYDGSWDFPEIKSYSNGGQTISCNNIKNISKFFEEMSQQLSAWM
jgi:hypothetical protein